MNLFCVSLDKWGVQVCLLMIHASSIYQVSSYEVHRVLLKDCRYRVYRESKKKELCVRMCARALKSQIHEPCQEVAKEELVG